MTEEDVVKQRFNKIRDEYGGIIYVFSFVLLILLVIILAVYGKSLSTNPCLICEEMGYVCMKNITPINAPQVPLDGKMGLLETLRGITWR